MNSQKDDCDDSIRFVPLISVENRMNDGDQKRLLQYLDPEFLDAIPDANAIDMELLAMEFKEKLNLTLEAEDNNIRINAGGTQDAIIKTPREYQFELYQKALSENVIVVLGTGAGKTLVSVMLIKAISLIEKQQRLVRQKTKLSFFLVSLVPLVFQQAKVIKANCDVALMEICGSMNVDSWTERQWEPIFEENDICVMTAQVFLDVLRRGFLSLDRVNLLIFDECHHAVKKHPFNLIMREFYDRCPFDSRPKIFGMTASPMVDNFDITNSIKKLEANMNCLVYTATNTDELEKFVPRPQEYIFRYNAPPIYPEPYPTARIRTLLGDIKKFKRFFQKAEDTLSHLGPWCCIRRCISLLSDKKYEIDDLEESLLTGEGLKIKEALDICVEIDLERNPDTSDISNFSPKVHLLITSLKLESQNPNFCGIVFVERRETAHALNELIQSIDDLGHIKSAVMVGHGKNKEGDTRFSYKEQNKIIEGFRTSEIKLLIATSVAEEGLDIQPCNYVYRFDPIHALISYIQSRGRARCQNSKYIVFTQRFSEMDGNMFNDLKRKEEQLKKFCQAIPYERNVANKFSEHMNGNYFNDSLDDEDYLEDSLFIRESGAVISKQNAIPLIFQYCNLLPADSYCCPKPSFKYEECGNAFRCRLRLPSNAPFTELYSPYTISKKRAKALVSLEACKKLRSLKLLDNHLKPFDYKKEILSDLAPETDTNGMVIGSRRRHNMYEKRSPQLWERVADLDDEVAKTEDDIDLLKARKNFDVERLKIVEAQSTPIKNIVDPKEEFLETQNGISKSMQNHQPCDLDGDLIMINENENHAENSPENEVPGGKPFSYWASILEIVTEDDKINGLPYRSLCIISRNHIPSLPQLRLFDRGQPFHVNIHNINIEIPRDGEWFDHIYDYMLNVMKTLLNKDFACPPEDVPYYILPLTMESKDKIYSTLTVADLEKSIDWNEINSIRQLKMDPFIIQSESSMKDIILIDPTNNERKYMIENIDYDLNPTSAIPVDFIVRESGCSNFQEYYTQKEMKPPSDLEQPMIHGRQIRRKLDYISKGTQMEPKIRGGAHAWLIPEFCRTFYMSLSVYQALLTVPCIMVRIDSFLLLKEAKQKFDLHIDDHILLEAYTAPSANMEMDYERLETLGDSILKLISTISLYVNYPFKDEGQLHHLRIRIVCNKALYRAAKRLKFYRYITSHTFNKRYWRPSHFTSTADNQENMEYLKYHRLSDKTLADIVESSLGASYISGGLESSLHTAIQMQIPLDNITCWADIYPLFKSSRKELPPRVHADSRNQIDIQRIKKITDYDFKNPLLVVEAMTHTSLPDSQVPCYQRLEFLGDAILDFMVVRYLYSKYTRAGPGKIAEMKDSCVNNNLLSIICLEIGLHKHILHYSGRIIQNIKDFENKIQEIKDSGKATREYWREVNIPKVLSDVVESMLGAVFVDSGFDIKSVEQVFEKWFLETFEKHISPELIVCHPVSKLIHTFRGFGCEGFKLRNQTSESTGKNSQKAVIFLHDKALANGSDSNIKVARRNAATRALRRLEDEPTIMEDVCNCRVSLAKRNSITKELVDFMDTDDENDD